MFTRFHLSDELLQQGCAERAALEAFNNDLMGLSCGVDADLVIRAQRPDWNSWDRVRVLWVSVCEDRGATRVAVGLVPEDLAAVHQQRHCNTKATFSRGWARRPLVEASLRYVIAALLDVNLPDNPFEAEQQKIPPWARALALHYLGLRELAPDALARFTMQGACNDAQAGTRTADLTPDIAPLLRDIDYLYASNGSPTLNRNQGRNFLAFSAIAISFACGAIERRSEASEQQIHRLKRQLPPEFRVELVSTLPKILRRRPIVARGEPLYESSVRIRTAPEVRSVSPRHELRGAR